MSGRVRRADEGSAVVEFLGATLLLLVPTVYLVLVLAALQAATFAVEGAAREAGRVLSAGPARSGVTEDAITAVTLAFKDQGLSADPATALHVRCAAACDEPGGTVAVTVTATVPLPGVPSFVRSVVPLSVPVSASHTVTIDPLAELG